MLLLLTSIICSVAVSVLLKLSQPARLRIEHAIAVNYVVAATLCLLLLRPEPVALMNSAAPWWLLAALGLALPAVFLVMAEAVRHAGIVLSDAAQRLSLLLPLSAAFLVFGEDFSLPRLTAIALAFLALLCLVAPTPARSTSPATTHKDSNEAEKGDANTTRRSHHTKTLFLLLGVWLGYGLIDIMFKQLARSTPDFSSSLFITFVLAAFIMAGYGLYRRQAWQTRNVLAGALLGALNFGNIYFYIRAHQAYPDSPTLIFTVMNIGVISLGALIGVGVFKESLSSLNIAGLILAVTAIVLMVAV